MGRCDIIGLYMCCDSWYPKAEITQLPKKYDNLALISNVRHDTALYELPPAKTGKKGRPKVRGRKLSSDDFEFSAVGDTDYSVGCRQVITNLFGKNPVYAIITKTSNGNQRLFICTKAPHQMKFDFHSSQLGKASLFAKTDIQFLPLTVYAIVIALRVILCLKIIFLKSPVVFSVTETLRKVSNLYLQKQQKN